MSFTKTIIAISVFFTASFAQADQCQWNGRFTAQTARAIMTKTDSLYTFCAPCGDTEVKAYMIENDNAGTKDGKAIHFRDQGTFQGQRYWEFSINEGHPNEAQLDLAYTYIFVSNEDGSNRQLVNVGGLVNGCTPQAVENIMEWDPAKVKCISVDGSCG